MISNVRNGLYVLVAILATAGTPRANADIVTDLEAHWTFNDAGDQQADDTSGNGNHATLGANGDSGGDSADPVWVGHGVLGSALKFDGGQYLKTSPIIDIGNGQVTYAMLVMQTDSNDYQYLISNSDSFDGYFLRVGFDTAGKIRLYSE
jgi:hypothetical protein